MDSSNINENISYIINRNLLFFKVYSNIIFMCILWSSESLCVLFPPNKLVIRCCFDIDPLYNIGIVSVDIH